MMPLVDLDYKTSVLRAEGSFTYGYIIPTLSPYKQPTHPRPNPRTPATSRVIGFCPRRPPGSDLSKIQTPMIWGLRIFALAD